MFFFFSIFTTISLIILMARWCGGEFAVLFDDTNEQIAYTIVPEHLLMNALCVVRSSRIRERNYEQKHKY